MGLQKRFCLFFVMAYASIVLSPVSFALNFEVFPIGQLADQSDFIGTATIEKRMDKENEHQYTARIGQIIKGDEEGRDIRFFVMRWAQEGELPEGKTLLLFLQKVDGRYQLTGIHQGAVRIEDGAYISRYYTSDEVNAFLKENGINEILSPEQDSETPAGRSDPKEQYSSDRHHAFAMIGMIGLSAITAWLIWIMVRKR